MRYDHSSTVLVARVSAVPGEVFRAFRSLSYCVFVVLVVIDLRNPILQKTRTLTFVSL